MYVSPSFPLQRLRPFPLQIFLELIFRRHLLTSIYFSFTQVDHDRGKWIYRGYLVGNINSNLAGRWRDTLSPAAVPGYEGCFLMTRRRGANPNRC
jgi:hypothetical protein